jgi:hypothetical protein
MAMTENSDPLADALKGMADVLGVVIRKLEEGTPSGAEWEQELRAEYPHMSDEQIAELVLNYHLGHAHGWIWDPDEEDDVNVAALHAHYHSAGSGTVPDHTHEPGKQ